VPIRNIAELIHRPQRQPFEIRPERRVDTLLDRLDMLVTQPGALAEQDMLGGRADDGIALRSDARAADIELVLGDGDDIVENGLMLGRKLAQRVDRPVAAGDALGRGGLGHRHDDRARRPAQARIVIDTRLYDGLDIGAGNELSHHGLMGSDRVVARITPVSPRKFPPNADRS